MKSFPIIWFFIIVLSCFYCYERFRGINPISSNIYSVIPEESDEKIALTKAINQRLDRKVMFFFKSTEKSSVKHASEAALNLVKQKHFLKPIDFQDNYKQLNNLLHNQPASFLTNSTLNALQKKDFQVLNNKWLSKLHSPFSIYTSDTLKEDPFFFQFDYKQRLAYLLPKGKSEDGILYIHDKHAVYGSVYLELQGSPFDFSIQKEYQSTLKYLQAIANKYGVKLLEFSVVAFASQETQQGFSEGTHIGLSAFLLICIIITVFFRSISASLFLFLVISSSLVVALSSCLYILGSMNILSLVIGTSLIGISVDYLFHYLSKRMIYGALDARNRVFKPISFGLLSSCICYTLIYLSDIGVLREVAIFSMAGLLSAYLTTLLMMPILTRHYKEKESLLSRKLIENHCSLLDSRFLKKVKFAAVCFVFAGGFAYSMLLPKNDISNFHSSPQYLLEHQKEIETLLDIDKQHKLLVISNNNINNLIESANSIDLQLEKMVKEGFLQSHDSALKLLPFYRGSEDQKHFILDYIDWFLASDNDTFLDDETLSSYQNRIANHENMSSDELWVSLSSSILEKYIYKADGKYFFIIYLNGVKDNKWVLEMAQKDNAYFINGHDDINAYLMLVYNKVLLYLIIAYLMIFILMLSLFGIRDAIHCIAPPLVASSVALVAILVAGQSLNLFHLVGMLLVLGVGVDFSVFYRYAKSLKDGVIAAIFMSMTSTVLAFGMMAFSHTPAIASFGLVVFVGMIVNYLVSPMAYKNYE